MIYPHKRLMLAMAVSLLLVLINIIAVSSGSADEMYADIGYSIFR